MTPYYEEDGVAIYHGDSRLLLPAVAPPKDVALLLTDPPYGMDYKPLRGSNGSKAWTNLSNRVQKFPLEWQGNCRNGEPFLHPTQKPVGLMRWLIENHTAPGDLVVDPYMGSGPVAVAARDLNRRYIGCDLVESYCEAAARRLSQVVLDFGGVA